jgi:hypothetical protein
MFSLAANASACAHAKVSDVMHASSIRASSSAVARASEGLDAAWGDLSMGFRERRRRGRRLAFGR